MQNKFKECREVEQNKKQNRLAYYNIKEHRSAEKAELLREGFIRTGEQSSEVEKIVEEKT
jgi:hypothetical protein